MGFIITSNNKFGICDTSIEGHDFINSMPGNGAFVMYVRTGDMIYAFLSEIASTTDIPKTSTVSPTVTPISDTTTSSTSTTSTSTLPTTTSTRIKMYYYMVYNVYNNDTTLIYSCKDDAGLTFSSANNARDNAYKYLCELKYNYPCDYFTIKIYWERYNAQNVIESDLEESFTYVYTTTTSKPFMVICDNCGHEYSRFGLNNNNGCPKCGHMFYTYK